MLHHSRVPIAILIAALLGAAALVACDGSDDTLSKGTSRVDVLLTDAPSDVIESAVVSISRVYLVGADDGSAVDLRPASEEAEVFDLLELQGGVEAALADALVPAARYGQLRLVVDEATVTLVPGVTFDDGTRTRTLHVPSGMQSGIKVLLGEPLAAEDDMLTVVVVDFDVDANFVLQGDPDGPAGLDGVTFTPTLTEARRNTVELP